MGTGQMLLVIGALTLFSIIALNVNATLVNGRIATVESSAGLMALNVGQGRLETLAAAGFAGNPIGVQIDTVATPLAAFRCSTRVDYVQAASPDLPVATATSLKRLSVTVTGDYLPRPITFRTLVGDY